MMGTGKGRRCFGLHSGSRVASWLMIGGVKGEGEQTQLAEEYSGGELLAVCLWRICCLSAAALIISSSIRDGSLLLTHWSASALSCSILRSTLTSTFLVADCFTGQRHFSFCFFSPPLCCRTSQPPGIALGRNLGGHEPRVYAAVCFWLCWRGGGHQLCCAGLSVSAAAGSLLGLYQRLTCSAFSTLHYQTHQVQAVCLVLYYLNIKKYFVFIFSVSSCSHAVAELLPCGCVTVGVRLHCLK